jgi:hypothetical protein
MLCLQKHIHMATHRSSDCDSDHGRWRLIYTTACLKDNPAKRPKIGQNSIWTAGGLPNSCRSSNMFCRSVAPHPQASPLRVSTQTGSKRPRIVRITINGDKKSTVLPAVAAGGLTSGRCLITGLSDLHGTI